MFAFHVRISNCRIFKYIFQSWSNRRSVAVLLSLLSDQRLFGLWTGVDALNLLLLSASRLLIGLNGSSLLFPEGVLAMVLSCVSGEFGGVDITM